jgi:hypothetical protein
MGASDFGPEVEAEATEVRTDVPGCRVSAIELARAEQLRSRNRE